MAFTQDLRFALRTVRNSPGFTAVAVLTLALGIGANAAIYSFVDGVLLKPLPYPHAEEIVNVWEKPPGGDRNGISTLNFLDWKNQNTVFTAMAAETGGSATLTGVDAPIQLSGSRVSAHYFDIFGLKPALGRTFAADEDQPGKEQVVVLSNRIWQSRFGADPGIIGRTIHLDDEPYTVIGVLSADDPHGRGRDDLWRPLAFEPPDMTRDFHWMMSWARLKPGVSIDQARTQMKTIAARIERQYPESNKGWSVTIDRYADHVVDDNLRRSLLVLLAAVGGVLLIGCANLANLLLARSAGREREIAIRAAMGASRWRLLQQLLTESVVIACVGGSFGVVLGYGLVAALKSWIPRFYLPSEAVVHMDGRVLAFTAAIILLTGLLFGIAPALHAIRSDLAGSLKEGGRGATTGVARNRLSGALVVAEIALAFVLLSGSGLLIRSFYRLQQVDPGFQTTNVLTMWLPMTDAEYPDGPRVVSYLSRVMEKIDAVPGVREAATTTALPLEGWGWGMPFLIEGHPAVDRANRPGCFYKMVSPSYFQALGMRLLKGRALSETDTQGSVPVAVVNESMVKRYFKNEEPLGKRVLIQQIIPAKHELGSEVPWQVVGVVADEKVNSLDDSSPGVYVSYKQSPTVGNALVVRGAVNPDGLIKSVERAVWDVNKNQALDDVKLLEQIKTESVGGNRLRTILLGGFALLALLLAAIGIYGVISYSVAQRTHELGVRAALGASYWDQIRLVLSSGLLLTAIGLGVGTVGALSLTRLLANLLFGVSPYDPATLIGGAVILALVAIAACFIPARRTTRVDPMIALRYE
ncbi:MAG TPA: ABC transporter permease [Bryobacteraceae bacterium]|nr:ABC transporter permease [Bryobacteraceae bacterium]